MWKTDLWERGTESTETRANMLATCFELVFKGGWIFVFWWCRIRLALCHFFSLYWVYDGLRVCIAHEGWIFIWLYRIKLEVYLFPVVFNSVYYDMQVCIAHRVASIHTCNRIREYMHTRNPCMHIRFCPRIISPNPAKTGSNPTYSVDVHLVENCCEAVQG